jgi:hypothetical protein
MGWNEKEVDWEAGEDDLPPLSAEDEVALSVLKQDLELLHVNLMAGDEEPELFADEPGPDGSLNLEPGEGGGSDLKGQFADSAREIAIPHGSDQLRIPGHGHLSDAERLREALIQGGDVEDVFEDTGGSLQEVAVDPSHLRM